VYKRPRKSLHLSISDSASGGRVGGGLAQLLPPAWTPSIITATATDGTRTGDEICDAIGGATMLHHPQGVQCVVLADHTP